MSRSRPAPLLDPPAGAAAARLQAARALVARHRRLAAALCAGAAVLAAVSALTPPAPVPALRDGAAGLAPVALPAGAGAASAGVAHRVAVTVRLADPAGTLLLRPGIHVEVIGGAPAGSVATAGLAADAAVLAADAIVLVVPQPTGDAAGGAYDGGLLTGAPAGSSPSSGALTGVAVLSVTPADAHRLAAAAGTRPLSVTVALPEP